LPVKASYQPVSQVKVNHDRNKRQQLQYRVQVMKGRRFISRCTDFYAIPNFQCLGTPFQQQGTKIQQVLKPKFIFWPGYFKHIKIDEGPECQRKLQRQPAPVRKVGVEPDVDTKYPNHPQDDGSKGKGQKPICCPADLFSKP